MSVAILDGAQVRRELARRALSQARFCELTGLDPDTFSRVLRGRPAQSRTLERIAEGLQRIQPVLADELLESTR